VPINLPKFSLNLPNRHNSSNWTKKAKKAKFHLTFYSKIKKAKGVAKTQKLQIWPQKSETGNTATAL